MINPSDVLARLERNDRFIGMAVLLSRSRTCRRRGVGCVLTNSYGHVLSTGFNGVASGEVHCITTACPGAGLPSGTGLDVCQAIHAEENALIQCSDITDIDTAWCSASPCYGCTNKLLNTSCQRIVFFDLYSHRDADVKWKSHGRVWEQYQGDQAYVEWLRSCPI